MPKITALSELTAPSLDDILAVVDDPTGSPVTMKAQLNSLLAAGGGWLNDLDTWVYVNASQFKVVGKDVTARFPKGTKLRLLQTTMKYFYAVATAMSGSDTLVTITGGSDYSLANAAIASPAYSYAGTPQGFPQWFNWTPTITGFSTPPSTVTRFTINGILVTCFIYSGSVGTSNATNYKYSLPVAPGNYGLVFKGVVAEAVDNGGQVTRLVSAACGYPDAVVELFINGSTWTASGIKYATFSFQYMI